METTGRTIRARSFKVWDPLLDARIRKQRMPNLGRFSDDSDLEGESDLDIFGFSDVLPGSCSGTFFVCG